MLFQLSKSFCDNPCKTMQVRFGYPEQHSNHQNQSHARFYFKEHIDVHKSVLTYGVESLMADISAYLGFFLGISVMDITGIIKFICLSNNYRFKNIFRRKRSEIDGNNP